jgi:hypothetical protein
MCEYIPSLVVINEMLVLLARQVIAVFVKKNYQNVCFIPNIYII